MRMSDKTIHRVAVIGTGIIGASWSTYFLGKGLSVTASDPAPDAESTLRKTVNAQWAAMAKLGLDPGASLERLSFAASLEAAVADVQFIQENGPERIDQKRELFSRLDAAALPDAIIATSSSTFTVSELQDACARNPERIVLGHPFNPPHLIPLVEVAGGSATSPSVIERTIAFYREIGKHPIHLKKESRGHVANRLQAALWQEAFHLVASGVACVADVDAAIAHGPGLRWALLGPFLNLHFSGGQGGIGALFCKPLWEATESMWRDLGAVSVDADLRSRRIADGITAELAAYQEAEMIRQRDDALLDILQLKAKANSLP
jgi:carnitine 3-dehydrogenase